jgi:hypothetical protein
VPNTLSVECLEKALRFLIGGNELFNKLSLVGGQRFPHDEQPFDARRVHAQNCKRRRTDHT